MTTWELIKADYQRYVDCKECKQGLFWMLAYAITGRNHCFSFSMYLRLASSHNILSKCAKYKWKRLSKKYGLQIHYNTKIGKGLYIAHGISMVVNHKTIIGDYCTLSHFLSIGSNHDTPAKIGDNVYIGPHVCIIENVTIGDNVKIGAGTVVIKDVPSNTTSVGNPNRIIFKKLNYD